MFCPLLKVVVTVTTTFFKVEFAIFQAILSFTILQFYAQRCNCKRTSRQAVPTVNSASVIYEYTSFTYLLCHSHCLCHVRPTIILSTTWLITHILKSTNFSLYVGKRIVFLATRSVLWPKTCRKCDRGRGAHDAPQTPESAGEGTPVPIPDPTRRIWRVNVRAFGASIVVTPDTKSWRRHWSPPLLR